MRWYVEPFARAADVNDACCGSSTTSRAGSHELEATAPVRIAVCVPQVPFERGGTEIFADGLVAGAARARPRGRARHRAVQVVPGRARADAGVPLAAARPRGGGRAADRRRDRDEVPVVRASAIRTRSSGCCTSSGRRGSSTAPSSASSPSRAEDRAMRREVQRLDRVALGEARKIFATSLNVADRLRGSTGLDAEVLPPPAAAARRTAATRVRGLHPLGEPARPREADRPAARGRRRRARRCASSIAGDGPDRERLERLARAGSNGRVAFTGRVSDEELADLYARCLAVYYAPVDEDFGMVPFEAFLSEKPVLTTTDAGGPLDVVHDRETGLVVAPEADELARACAWLREHADEAAAWAAPGKAVAERGHVGLLRSTTAARREGRVLLAAAARARPASPTTARCCCRRSGGGSRSSSRGAASAARAAPTSRSTTSATTPTRTAGSSTRCGAARRRRAARLRPPPPRRRDDARPQGRARLPRRDGARGRRRRPPARLRRARRRVPPLWETRPEEFPLAGEVLDSRDRA